jgi:uncharacterized protein (DUF885 family)
LETPRPPATIVLRSFLRSALAAAILGAPAVGAERPAEPGSPARLRSLAHDHYLWSLEDQPVAASDQGLHTWDDRLASFAPAAVQARSDRARALLAEVDAMDDRTWSVEDRIARALFRSQLERETFAGEVLKREIRDPGLYVEECTNGVFSLLKKEYAPRASRAKAAAARLRAMPDLLRLGLSNLTSPVPILARLAAESAESSGPLFSESLMVLADGLPDRERAELVAARDAALGALREFAAALRRRGPEMRAPLAMGTDAYNRMLARVHLLPFDAGFVAALGRAELARAKALESWLPDPRLAEVSVEGVKDLPRDQADFLAQYEARTADLVAHIRRRDLLTLPAGIGPFRTLELPRAFKPTSPGGFMNPPGLFDADPTGFYFIPTYDPASPNFYIRAALVDPRPILGHEGIPGHFLQLSIARKHPDEIRRMHQDGIFVEGWGLYQEEMLLRTGLYEDSPAGHAQVLRLMRYRAARVTVDVNLHTGVWDFDQAVDYFMKEGGLDREAATGEAAGAAATPGQKIHYTVGKWQILRLLGRYRDAKGAAFTLRGFHDALLAQGSLPLSLVEWAILGDDASYREAVRLGSPEGGPAGP